MGDKFRVGVIGCGGMAANHVSGYLECDRFQISAISDLSSEAMIAFDKKFNGYKHYQPKHYLDAYEMLDSENLDVVSIATWHKGHAKWTIAAAARKPKAILCEKPMAEDIGHAADMITACERNNVKLTVGHQRRFLPSYVETRNLIEKGAIGKVQMIRSISGSGLLNWASHLFDMLRYLIGDDDCDWVMGAVERNTDRYERSIRIEDRALCSFGFKSGADGLVLSDFKEDYYQGCTVIGSEGIIELRPEYYRLMNSDTKGNWSKISPRGKYFQPDESGFEMKEGAVLQAEELADWIQGNVQNHRGEALHGYKAVEMACAVYESSRLHEMIRLPLKTRVYPLDLMVESEHLPIQYPGHYDIRASQLRGENMISDENNK